MGQLFQLCLLILLPASYSCQPENSRAPRNPLPSAGPFISTQRSLDAIKIDPSGKAYTTQISKQQLANELDLPLRDLRIVDPSYPSQIMATFTARKNAILFCIENIKVVVQHDEALVFGPLQPEVQEFIPAVQAQIEQAVAGKDGRSDRSVRFEHIVLEAALNVVCCKLLNRVRALSPSVTSALSGLRAESRGLNVIQTQADELLPLKNKIDELKKRIKEVRRAITEILSNDNDMSMMYLSTSRGKKANIDEILNVEMPSDSNYKKSNSDTMNLEMLFENYLNEIEWMASEVEEILDEIKNTEENVVLQLDILRNRILRFELSLSMSSFVVTCGALVTGLFGMNLTSHLELNKNMFYIVSALMTAAMSAMWIQFNRYGFKTFGRAL